MAHDANLSTQDVARLGRGGERTDDRRAPAPESASQQAPGWPDPLAVSQAAASPAPAPPGETTSGDVPLDVPLVEPGRADVFVRRWRDIQARFVDDPGAAVGAADALVAEVMQHIAANFADHKSRLEGQWNRGAETETEELRIALQRYRSFFHRLLSA